MQRKAAEATHPCQLCAGASATEVGICADCQRSYGPRVARLLARAERDPDFAAACLAHFPPALRERFAALLGKRWFLAAAEERRGPGLRAARPRPTTQWLKVAN